MPHLVVTLLDSGGEVAISRHHQQAHIGLSSTGDHVFDEVSVTCGKVRPQRAYRVFISDRS